MLIATSNVDDLGVNTLFRTPAAILRRFGIFARMKVKPQFACPLGRLSPPAIAAFQVAEAARIAANPDAQKPYSDRFPPFWDFEILVLDQNGVTGQVLQTFNDPESATIDFLEYVFANVDAHERNQERVMNSFANLKGFTKCGGCNRPSDVCVCVGGFRPTSLDVFDPQEDFGSFFSFILIIVALMCLCPLFWFYNPISLLLSFFCSCFVWTAVTLLVCQIFMGLFVNRVHLEPLTSSAKLPMVMLLNMTNSCFASTREMFAFLLYCSSRRI